MNLEFYGAKNLDRVADLVGDFDARSTRSTDDWLRKQWARYAGALGFADDFERLVRGRARSKLLMHDAGLRAFLASLTRRNRPQDPELARVRHKSLVALRSLSPHHLWLTDIMSSRLPEGACVNSEKPVDEIDGLLGILPAVQPQEPVFKPLGFTNTYFYNRSLPADIPCIYKVRLSLGTFPIVHGDNLADPAGLRWGKHKNWRPAHEAMRICAGFWTQRGNLQQDARDVVAAFTFFRRVTARVLDRKLPGSRDSATGVLTPSGTRTRIAAPRGPLTVNGYNLTLLAFAAFFAARRAYLRAPETWTTETRAAAKKNPDPVLLQHLKRKRAV